MKKMLTNALGSWVKIPAIESVQILAHAGFDYVVIDLEHSMIDLRSAYELISMANALRVLPLVRVPDITPSRVQCILDAGAAGILFPHIDNAEAAKLAVQAVRFPPAGTRGAGGTSRAGDWGRKTQADYIAFGNQEVLCIPQLESHESYVNREAIAAVPGVDALFIGAADLAMDMGSEGDKNVFDQIFNNILETAHRHDKICGFAVGAVSQGVEMRKRGFDFIMVSNDTSMLTNKAVEIAESML